MMVVEDFSHFIDIKVFGMLQVIYCKGWKFNLRAFDVSLMLPFSNSSLNAIEFK